MALNYKFPTVNNQWSTTTTILTMKLKFSNTVKLSSLYWYRGTTNLSPTVTPRIYNMSGQLIGNGIGLAETTRTLGWYKLDLSTPVQLEKDIEYLIGFYFLNGAPIGSGSTTTPAVFNLGDNLNLTYNSMYSGTSDTVPTSTNNNVLLSIGFDYVTYSDKFLISSEDKFLSVVSNTYSDNLIPKMTSNSSPSGISSAFSELSGYEAWKAFDQNDVTEWHWNNNGGISIAQAFISYKFAEKVVINKYSMSIASNRAPATYSPKDWTFEGSNDGTNWTVLDTRKNETAWISGVLREFSFASDTQYLWYRIRITATNGSSVAFNSINMFRKKTDALIYLPNSSESMFLSYGLEKGTELALDSQFQSLNIKNINSSTLGSGKVFKQKIDTSKAPIKKVSIT